MNPRARVEAVLSGRRPDRPPVGFWHHFPPEQATGEPAVEAHLRFIETYGLDFVKAMNDHPYPRGEVQVVRTVADLKRIRSLPGDTGGFAGQLEVLRRLRERLGPEVPICTTIFNAWTVLRTFTAPPSDRHGPPRLDGTDKRDDVLSQLLREDAAAFQAAIDALGETLAAFAQCCVQAGSDGVFLSVRDDWVDRPANGEGTYARVVRGSDLRILSAVSGAWFNVLHMCGRPMHFEALAAYPVSVVNWADRAAGPSIAWARDRARPAIAGGVDNLNTLPKGTPGQCAEEVRDALQQAGDRPIIVAAGCTFDPLAVPPENLRAVVAAAHGG